MFFSLKKQQEIRIIQSFIQQFKEFPKGKLVKSESPDFILKINPKIAIGIELTRLRPPDNLKKSYELHDLEFNKEILEQTILGKEEKLELYRKKRLDQIWLIITGEQAMVSPHFHIGNKLQNWSFRSGFNRIFLFDSIGTGIFELNITNEE